LDEEALLLWQDVLDEIVAGRTNNLSCPHCRHQPLAVVEDGMRTRVSCSRCGEFIEGRFGAN
jgi:transcription elongation factor Elf1